MTIVFLKMFDIIFFLQGGVPKKGGLFKKERDKTPAGNYIWNQYVHTRCATFFSFTLKYYQIILFDVPSHVGNS